RQCNRLPRRIDGRSSVRRRRAVPLRTQLDSLRPRHQIRADPSRTSRPYRRELWAKELVAVVAAVTVALPRLCEPRGVAKLFRQQTNRTLFGGTLMPRVIHFEISADDPQRAADFYARVFGWKITKWDGPQPYWLV